MADVKNILNKYSNGEFPTYDFDKKDREFAKLSELELKTKYTILALFINTSGKFGDQGVIYTDDKMVNLPNHLTKLIKELRSDSEVTQAINERELAFEVYSYETDNGRSGYSINIVESEAF